MLKQTILAFEVAGEVIRSVLVQGQGKKITILDYAEIKRPKPEEDLPDIKTLKKLAKAMKYTGRKAVYVTALARSTELFMDRKKVAPMSLYQLAEAAKWEIESYTGISGRNALVGVEKEKKAKARPGEIVYEDDSDEMLVNISAIERNVYVAIKERFKAAGLKLVRIYPPEVCFYMPLALQRMDSTRAILEIGVDYSNFAIFNGRHPDQISTLNFSSEAILSHIHNPIGGSDLESSLKFTLSQAPDHEPVVLTGPGAAIGSVVDFLDRLAPSGVVPLSIFRGAQITSREADPEDAVFGTAAGAGVRELSGQAMHRTGIDDTLPLVVRIKKNAYVMPLLVTGLLAVGLLGHNQFMKHQERRFKSDIQKYTAMLEKNKNAIQKYEGYLKQSTQLKKDIQAIEDRIRYVNEKADRQLESVIKGFGGIARAVPDGLVLDAISQDTSDPDLFHISGRSWDLNTVGVFSNFLQDNAWCRSAVLKSLSAGSDNRRLSFEIALQMDPEAVSAAGAEQ